MSINVSVGFQIPTNVVEVGNEITSDQLAAITSATTPTSANPFLTLAGGTLTGAVYVPQINNILNTDLVIDAYNDAGAGTHYLHKFDNTNGRFLLATNGGGLTFPDGSTQTVAGYPNTNPSGFITSSGNPPLKAISTGSGAIDGGDNYYIYVIGNMETLTIDDEVNNDPPIGTELTVVSSSSNGNISCSGSVTCNGSTGFTLPSYTVLKLVKIAANTWWIG